MTASGRRTLLYGSCVVLAAGLLFAGYGITVPPDAGTRLNGAAILAGMGEYDKALAECRLVLEEHPDNLDARIFRATFLAMAERHGEAVAAYDDALGRPDVTPSMRLDLLQDRAGALLAAGRTDEFARARSELAAEGGKDRVLVLDGIAAAGREEWGIAADRFAEALALRPEDQGLKARLWNALVARGDHALAGGDYTAAAAAYDHARTLFPRAGKAHLKAAEVRLATGDVQAALPLLREAGAGTAGGAPLVCRGSVLLLEAGDMEGALDARDGDFVVDPAGTKALLQKEPAWISHHAHPEVKALLEMDEEIAGRFDGREASDR